MYANVTFAAEMAVVSGFIMCRFSVSSTDGSIDVAIVGMTQPTCDAMLAWSPATADFCIPNIDLYTSMDYPNYKVTAMDVDSGVDITECPTESPTGSSANLLGLSAFGLISIVAFFN
jgi:hypothetical protein